MKEICCTKKTAIRRMRLFYCEKKEFKPAGSIQMDTTFDVDRNTLTVATSNLYIRLFFEKEGYMSSLAITTKIPKDGKAEGLCGQHSKRGALDDEVSFGPAHSLVSAKQILKYHDIIGMKDDGPFCLNNYGVEDGVNSGRSVKILRLDKIPDADSCHTLNDTSIYNACKKDFGSSNKLRFAMYKIADRNVKRINSDKSMAQKSEIADHKTIISDSQCTSMNDSFIRRVCLRIEICLMACLKGASQKV